MSVVWAMRDDAVGQIWDPGNLIWIEDIFNLIEDRGDIFDGLKIEDIFDISEDFPNTGPNHAKVIDVRLDRVSKI